MNLDLSIHRMAFREAETLGMAQMLVARKRQEFELKVARETVTQGTAPSGATVDQALKDTAPSGATVDQALKDMEERSAEFQREAPPVNDSGVLVDKTA